MSVEMICPRDYTLRTRTGHCIRFEAGVPTNVPDDLVADALAMNIVPRERPDNEKPAFGLVTANITGSLRDALIFRAITEIVARNNHEEFDGGGVPKLVALNQATGLSLGTAERSKYWARYLELTGTNSELPTHPNVELVIDLQALTSRKQLEEFAKEAGIDFTKLSGKPLKEIKTQLLSYVINQKPHVELRSSTLQED